MDQKQKIRCPRCLLEFEAYAFESKIAVVQGPYHAVCPDVSCGELITPDTWEPVLDNKEDDTDKPTAGREVWQLVATLHRLDTR